MYVLRGICLQKGRLNQHHDIIREEPSGTDPCPICGSVRKCDVHWEHIRPFDEYEMEEIANNYDGIGGCNVFPGGVPGPFNPRLVIFVDHPEATRERILERIRRRISMHQDGQRTYELIFVSRRRGTMQAKMGVKEKFGQLVDQWRFFEPSFAPMIEFRDIDGVWVRTYHANQNRMIYSHAVPNPLEV